MSDTPTIAVKDTNRLVEECQGLVRHLAMQIRSRTPQWIETDDLISYGQLGLLQAAKDFDPSKGVKFSTFAFYRIRGAIFDGVNKLNWFRAARDPETKYNQMADDVIQQTMSESRQEDGKTSSGDLVAEASWLGQIASSLAVVYLAATDGDQMTDVVDAEAADPSDEMMERETSDKLKKALEQLPVDAAALMRAVYYEDRTLQEAADRLGISKSWASRVHARALEQLARTMRQIAPEEAS
jgi:RNA polymerase sigma factor for flagellar operon FliA